MAELQTGDWITVETVVGQKQGFVEDMTPWNVLIRPLKDGQLQERIFVGKERVRKANLAITCEDIETMVDLALATNDKEWFEELTELFTTMKTLEELY